MFSSDDLRDLTRYLKERADDLRKKESIGTVKTSVGSFGITSVTPTEESHQLVALARQVEALRYNPMLFADLLEQYDVEAGPMDQPLDQLPLHINDCGVISQAVVRWRLQRGV